MKNYIHLVKELEQSIQVEQQQQLDKERLRTVLDELHYEGFTDNLNTEDYNFYLEQYKEFI